MKYIVYVTAALSTLMFTGTFACALLNIWTDEPRWGKTAGPFIFAAIVLAAISSCFFIGLEEDD